MKRYLVPLVAGAVVFGGVTAFAATLNVSSTTLGSGDQTVASCNGSAAVTYTTAYTAVAGSGSYKVATSPITTAAACSGKAYKVTLTGANGTALAERTGSLGTDGTATPDFGSTIPAASVTGVSVVVAG